MDDSDVLSENNTANSIKKKNFKDVTTGVRAVYQKGVEMIDKRQMDYGIELLKQVVQKEPGFIEARKVLRAAEKEKTSAMSGFANSYNNWVHMAFVYNGSTATAFVNVPSTAKVFAVEVPSDDQVMVALAAKSAALAAVLTKKTNAANAANILTLFISFLLP